MKKYVIMVSIMASILGLTLVEAKTSNNNENVVFDASIKIKTLEAEKLKKIIEASFKSATDMNASDESYAVHHSKEYVQHVDGKVMNYEEYVTHKKAIKKTIKSLKVVFHDMLFDGNKVVTRHTAYAVKNDDKEIEVQVIAIFEIKDDKIITCDELTFMQKGERSDRDLGSRH